MTRFSLISAIIGMLILVAGENIAKSDPYPSQPTQVSHYYPGYGWYSWTQTIGYIGSCGTRCYKYKLRLCRMHDEDAFRVYYAPRDGDFAFGTMHNSTGGDVFYSYYETSTYGYMTSENPVTGNLLWVDNQLIATVYVYEYGLLWISMLYVEDGWYC